MSGIYIHIPFCKQACHYCNFHFSTSLKQKDALVQGILKEIFLTTPFSANENIETIYFGGGTPSILNVADLKNILEALTTKFNILPDAEITLEANPDDIDSFKLTAWKQLGINRLSVGIQSFLEDELVWMNRAHNAAESLHCIDLINAAGYTNYSVDLIYGSPLLSNKNWIKNIDTVIQKNIPHISCYALTVEPKTALDKMIALHKKQPVDADKQAEQFLLLMAKMEEAGYDHYEISNYALPGKRSKHNSSYWQAKTYYGFGPSAHSFNQHTRRWNISNNATYIAALQNNSIPFEEEKLTTTQQLNEYIMTALRTMEGLDLEKLQIEFGEKNTSQILQACKKWIAGNKLVITTEGIKLTTEGKLFADGIAADLFF